MRRSVALAAMLGVIVALLPVSAASAVPLPTGSVSGTVRDASGVPLVDAELTLASASHDFDVFSTAGGAYSLTGIPAGSYEGHAFPPSGLGGYGFLSFTLVVGPGTVYDPIIPRRSDIAVTVTDGVNPVPDVIVAAISVDAGVGSSNGPDGTPSTGLFTTSVSPGTFVVSIQPPDGSDYAYQFATDATSYAAADQIVAVPDATGSPFVRTVVLATNTDQITGHVTLGGAPVADGFLYLYNSEGQNLAEFLVQPDGSFSSAGVPDGSYTIQAYGEEPGSGDRVLSQMQAITVNGGDVVSPDLVLALDPGSVVTGAADGYSVAQDSVLTRTAALGVLANDSVAPASTMTVRLVTTPAHGSLFLQFDGGFAYAPADGFVGTDTFQYRPAGVSDQGGTVTVTVTVLAALAATGRESSFTVVALGLLAIVAGIAAILVVRRRRSVV